MNSFEWIILIAVLVVMILVGVILYVELTRKSVSDTGGMDTHMKALENEMKASIQRSYYDLNQSLMNQLLQMTKQSGNNMSELQVKMGEYLSGFQEKMTDRFNVEFKGLTQTFQSQMAQINSVVETRLDKGFRDANQTFMDIAKRVEVIDHAQANIKKLSEEMVSLQSILSNNQTRGAFGEYQLNQLLASIYGQNDQLYQTQYTIQHDKKSVRVDAAIFMPKPNAIIPIDSKFPYASYQKLFASEGVTKNEEAQLISQFGREVKKHITDIANKYILPPKTVDYAIMFVPSDGVLSLIHAKLPNVVTYAREKSITICSPTTIVPLLSSFKAFVIDYKRTKHMEKINHELIKLGRDFRNFGEEWRKLNRSITSVVKNSEKMDSRVEKMASTFTEIKNVGMASDEKPE